MLARLHPLAWICQPFNGGHLDFMESTSVWRVSFRFTLACWRRAFRHDRLAYLYFFCIHYIVSRCLSGCSSSSSELRWNYNAAEDKLSAGKLGKLIACKLQVGMSSSGALKLTQHFRCSALTCTFFLIQNHHCAHTVVLLRPLSLSAKSIIVLFFFCCLSAFWTFWPWFGLCCNRGSPWAVV